MNVASLELSKELHELSGWDEGEYVYATVTGSAPQPFHKSMIGRLIKETTSEYVCPAYSLGYLLRKLQEHPRIKLRQLAGRRWDAERLWGELQSDKSVKKCLIAEVGDTPENALCKLAIELFKQGILKKENI